MPRISLFKRELVKQYLKEGTSLNQTANLLQISRCAIRNIQKKIRKGLGVEDLPRSGRKSSLTLRQENALVITSKKNPFYTARQVKNSSLLSDCCSLSTVKRILRKNKLFGRIAAKKPKLNKRQMHKRLEFAKHVKSWTSTDWQKVIFSDESKIELYPRRRNYVRRPVGKRLDSKYISGTTKFSPSLMFWGAIRCDGAKVLKLCRGSIDSEKYTEILNENLPKVYNSRFIFQHDNATCHTSRSTQKYLENKAIRVLNNWPSQSPDLNIIENIWEELKENVYKRGATNLEDLERLVLEEWESLSEDFVRNCFNSIPDRIRSVIIAKGGNTRY